MLRTGRLLGKLHHLNEACYNNIFSRSYRGSRMKKLMMLNNSQELMKDFAKNVNPFGDEEPFEFPKEQPHPKAIEMTEQLKDFEKYLEFPSDTETFLTKVNGQTKNKRYQANNSFRPKVDPRQTTVLLFPGQGSQFVGMGKKLLQYPKVQEMYSIASAILGFDLLKVCLDGPKEELDKTLNCQPAVVVTSLAAVEKLKAEKPWAIETCVTTAGYSVGEISALVFAGVLSFEDAIALVKVRSQAMQKASNDVGSAMMSVSITPETNIKFACHAAKLFCSEELGMDHPVCDITNFLHPGCKVIAGNSEALEFITRNAEKFKIRKCSYLPVSGAFHSRLMKPAAWAIQKSLEKLKINDPVIPVHSNVTGKRFKDAFNVKELIVKQVCKPVMWEQTIHNIYTRPQEECFPMTFEVGPGKQLGLVLSKVNKKAYEEYQSVAV